MHISPVSWPAFREAFTAARADSDLIARMTSAPEELPRHAIWYLSDDSQSGFGIAEGDELVALFSRVRGRGQSLIEQAIAAGAARLDAFDGFLPALYARHGFEEVAREANWTPGEPDIVYMRRAA